MRERVREIERGGKREGGREGGRVRDSLTVQFLLRNQQKLCLLPLLGKLFTLFHQMGGVVLCHGNQ